MSSEVAVGFFSFTEVTEPSEHRAYNEWHQLDHLPQQYEIPGVVHGQRWVRSPACRDVQAFEGEGMSGFHYMTLYLMSEPVAETLESFRELGGSLAAAGRFHSKRRAAVAGPFSVLSRAAAPRVLVSAEVVPFRPNLGVYVVLESTGEGPATSGGPEQRKVVERFLEEPGVAGAWCFASIGGFEHLGWTPAATRATVLYLDSEPLEVAGILGEAVRDLWKDNSDPDFAGPLETVVPWQWDWFDHAFGP